MATRLSDKTRAVQTSNSNHPGSLGIITFSPQTAHPIPNRDAKPQTTPRGAQIDAFLLSPFAQPMPEALTPEMLRMRSPSSLGVFPGLCAGAVSCQWQSVQCATTSASSRAGRHERIQLACLLSFLLQMRAPPLPTSNHVGCGITVLTPVRVLITTPLSLNCDMILHFRRK